MSIFNLPPERFFILIGAIIIWGFGMLWIYLKFADKILKKEIEDYKEIFE